MVKRCRWVSDSQDEKMVAYHDQEFGQPVFDDDRLLFELLTLELFQSGLSWKTVLNKRENFKRAFADFDVEKVAAFDNQDVERLLADSGIIRNRMKIDATINNAKQIQRLQNEGKSFLSSSGSQLMGKPYKSVLAQRTCAQSNGPVS